MALQKSSMNIAFGTMLWYHMVQSRSTLLIPGYDIPRMRHTASTSIATISGTYQCCNNHTLTAGRYGKLWCTSLVCWNSLFVLCTDLIVYFPNIMQDSSCAFLSKVRVLLLSSHTSWNVCTTRNNQGQYDHCFQYTARNSIPGSITLRE